MATAKEVPGQKSLGQRRILVLICSAGMYPWDAIEELGQKGTFAEFDAPNVRFIWYQGTEVKGMPFLKFCSSLFESTFRGLWFPRTRASLIKYKFLDNFVLQNLVNYLFNRGLRRWQHGTHQRLENRILKIPLPRRYGFMGARAMVALKYAESLPDWDFVLRTNSSSYFDLQMLQQVVEKLPVSRVYAGVTMESHGVRFQSGAANILSRDVVGGVADRAMGWNHFFPEDLALGKIVQEENLADLYPLRRVDLSEIAQAKNYEMVVEDMNWHFRCKASKPEISIAIMKILAAKESNKQNHIS